VVLRPATPSTAAPLLGQLQELGVRHAEIAWRADDDWSGQCRQLIGAFPDLLLGASSICGEAALEAVLEAGFAYGFSPVLEETLLQRAATTGFTLIPGVMSPTEVNRARALGARMVKLFPAATLGAGYWRSLRAPLGSSLPFCVAAGGLGPGDVRSWLAAGVDAVALGGSLAGGRRLDPGIPAGSIDLAPLRQLLAELAEPAAVR